MAAENGIPLSWILLFVLLALGIGVWAIFFVGGDLIGPAGVIGMG